MKRVSILKFITKKAMSAALCILLLLTIVPSVQAAGVPQEVLDAAESVVFIVEAYETEQFASEVLANARKENPDIFFNSGGKEYVINGSTGSGFIIKNEGGAVLIVTNNHVVEDQSGNIIFDNIFVYLTRDRVAHAEIVFAEPEKDLCVIRIRESTTKKAVPLATEDAQRGEAAYAVGFPGVADDLSGGIALTSEEATITDGIISAVRSNTKMIDAGSAKMLQLNVSINHGNSGGPLFNSEGNVIGINSWGIAEQNMYGAVAVSELWSLLNDYGIDIPAAEKAEPAVPAAPQVTAPAARPQERNIVPFVAAGAAVLCVAVLIIVLQQGKKRKKAGKKQTEEIVESNWEDPPVVKPVNIDVSMTPSRQKGEPEENNQSMDDYFKKIKLQK